MEFNDLEDRWKDYSRDLEKNLILNTSGLKREKLQRSEQELFLPLLHEILNILVVALVVIAVGTFSFIHLEELQFSLPGLLGAGIGSVYVYYAAAKAIKISNIDYYSSSILAIQKNISSLKLLTLKYRKLELVLFPIFIVLTLPIIFKVIQKRDLYVDLSFYLFEALFVIGFGIIGIYFSYKYLYDHRIKRVQLFIDEIKEFES